MSEAFRNWNPDGRAIDAPPAYFLQRLYDFDAMLVLLPSREQPGAYVLGRRKQWGPGLTEAAIDAMYTKADTKMAILNGTVPVCMVFKPTSGSWNPDPLIRSLMARDIWAHGGAEKVADMQEAQEDAERAAQDKATRDDLYNRSGDAWRSYQARTGQSSIHFKEMPSKTQQSAADGEVVAPQTTTGARSTAGLGQPRKRGATIGRRGTKDK